MFALPDEPRKMRNVLSQAARLPSICVQAMRAALKKDDLKTAYVGH